MSRPRYSLVPARLRRFLHDEAAPGILLMTAAAAALILANSALAHNYHDWFHTPFAWSPVTKLGTAHLWINDALMAVFFFVVGLEIKREVLDGELATPAARRLPIVAAAAGMAAPAVLFLAIAGGSGDLARGWAIPAATDIAFAIGVIALLGNRVPPALRLFLLTIAIVDDLGAVAIIALFYTAQIDLLWLGVAFAVLVGLALINARGVRAVLPYLAGALLLWFAVLHSGVHATVAGVLAAFCVPYRLNRRGDSPLLRLEHFLVPWSGFVIVPLFGFANAGVALAGAQFGPLALGIAVGLFAGKQAGILGALWIGARLGLGRIAGASWTQVWGMALLCGIGFTMSLFIASLAFPAHPGLDEQAKLGVLAGSLASALLGYAVLRLSAAKDSV